MGHRLSRLGLLSFLAVAGCAEDGGLSSLTAAFGSNAGGSAAGDAGSALVEARQCGRAIAVAARCNYMRDDRDVAALRFAVLQGLSQRHGSIVGPAQLGEAVDLAVLDRLSTIGQCRVEPADVPVLRDGLREVLGECAAP
jgi:hypothetical protein